jgi:hypothetical protein
MCPPAAPLNANMTNAGNNNAEMAVSPTTGRVYTGVVINGQLTYMGFSDNQGGAWTQMDLPVTNDAEGVFTTNPDVRPGGQGATHFSIVVDPNIATTVYIGGDRQPSNGGAAGLLGQIFPAGCSGATPPSLATTPEGTRRRRRFAPMGASDHTPEPGVSPAAARPTPRRTPTRATWPSARRRARRGGRRRHLWPHQPQNNTGDWFSLIGDAGSGLQVTEIHDIAYDSNSTSSQSGHQDTGSGAADRWLVTVDRVPLNPAPVSSFGIPLNFTRADGGDVAVDNLIGVVSPSASRASKPDVSVAQPTTRSALCRPGHRLAGPAITVSSVTPLAVNGVAANRLVIGGLTACSSR